MNTTTTHCYRPVLVSDKVIYMQIENQKAIPQICPDANALSRLVNSGVEGIIPVQQL
jgi:hypothetical protein